MEPIKLETDRAAVARATRSRTADEREAERLRGRGWDVRPPCDLGEQVASGKYGLRQ
jgi:hypothetical protein